MLREIIPTAVLGSLVVPLEELRAGPREEEIGQSRPRIFDLEEDLALTGKKCDRARGLFQQKVISQRARR